MCWVNVDICLRMGFGGLGAGWIGIMGARGLLFLGGRVPMEGSEVQWLVHCTNGGFCFAFDFLGGLREVVVE